VYYLTTLWFGIVLLLAASLAAAEPFRLLLGRVAYGRIGLVVLGVTALAAAYSLVNARHCRVVVYTIPAPVSLRLAHISDLHIGSVSSGYVRGVVDAVNSLNPDAILATGDILDSPNVLSQESRSILRQLKAPVYCVTGNHERYAGLEKATAVLQSCGFTVLRGTVTEFRGVRIIGFDDEVDVASLEAGLKRANLDQSAFNILLFHRPEGFTVASQYGIRLMLAGHTHGGQIFPYSLLTHMRFTYPRGLYHLGQAMLYTTQGTGNWGPQMRLGTHPEIAIFELTGPETRR
jgi:hypothetical protein